MQDKVTAMLNSPEKKGVNSSTSMLIFKNNGSGYWKVEIFIDTMVRINARSSHSIKRSFACELSFLVCVVLSCLSLKDLHYDNEVHSLARWISAILSSSPLINRCSPIIDTGKNKELSFVLLGAE